MSTTLQKPARVPADANGTTPAPTPAEHPTTVLVTGFDPKLGYDERKQSWAIDWSGSAFDGGKIRSQVAGEFEAVKHVLRESQQKVLAGADGDAWRSRRDRLSAHRQELAEAEARAASLREQANKLLATNRDAAAVEQQWQAADDYLCRILKKRTGPFEAAEAEARKTLEQKCLAAERATRRAIGQMLDADENMATLNVLTVLASALAKYLHAKELASQVRRLLRHEAVVNLESLSASGAPSVVCEGEPCLAV